MLVPAPRKFCAAIAVAIAFLSGLAGTISAQAPSEIGPAESCPQCRQCEKGCAQSIAWYAQPSNTPRYTGYYVGGGATFKGEPRFVDEGTWGWDYSGAVIRRHVLLDWWHGQRAQGGIGSYRTDGPRLLQPH